MQIAELTEVGLDFIDRLKEEFESRMKECVLSQLGTTADAGQCRWRVNSPRLLHGSNARPSIPDCF